MSPSISPALASQILSENASQNSLPPTPQNASLQRGLETDASRKLDDEIGRLSESIRVKAESALSEIGDVLFRFGDQAYKM